MATTTSPIVESMSEDTATEDSQYQTLTLPSGRQLGYATCGPALTLGLSSSSSSSNSPAALLYLHGFPSSRLEPSLLGPAFFHRLNTTVITIDRPGFGTSTPDPNLSLLSFTEDVHHFVDALKIDKFAILGTSGGGPYAVACAKMLPRARLTAVGLFATGPHWGFGGKYVSKPRKVMRWLSIRWPSGLTGLLNAMVGTLRFLASRNWVRRKIGLWLEAASKKTAEEAKAKAKDDLASATVRPEERTPEQRTDEVFRIVIDEPFRQGARATTQEAKILSDPDWGFELEEVDYNPIHIWHGDKDTNAPIEMIRAMAEKLPNTVLHEFKGETHYTLAHHFEDVMKEVISPKE